MLKKDIGIVLLLRHSYILQLIHNAFLYARAHYCIYSKQGKYYYIKLGFKLLFNYFIPN